MRTALLLLLSVPALAAQDQPFSTACDYYRCVDEIAAIEAAFLKQGPLQPANAPAVYSGECRHLSPDYSQEKAHYGMVFLEKREGETLLHFNGQFGFFYDENPWKDWDVARARAETAEPFKYPVSSLDPRYTVANVARDYPDVAYQYWLSEDPGKRELYVIGAWGTQRRVYCRLPRQA